MIGPAGFMKAPNTGKSRPNKKNQSMTSKCAANCAWSANEDGAYETTCGNIFEFNADGPTENGFKFCPYCGASITRARRRTG